MIHFEHGTFDFSRFYVVETLILGSRSGQESMDSPWVSATNIVVKTFYDSHFTYCAVIYKLI